MHVDAWGRARSRPLFQDPRRREPAEKMQEDPEHLVLQKIGRGLQKEEKTRK